MLQKINKSPFLFRKQKIRPKSPLFCSKKPTFQTAIFVIFLNQNVENTVKALLSPRGAYLILDLPEGGLNREGGLLERGGLFTKSSEKDIFGSFSVPLFHILRIQYTIFRLKYTDSTQFLSHIILKLTCKVV